MKKLQIRRFDVVIVEKKKKLKKERQNEIQIRSQMQRSHRLFHFQPSGSLHEVHYEVAVRLGITSNSLESLDRPGRSRLRNDLTGPVRHTRATAPNQNGNERAAFGEPSYAIERRHRRLSELSHRRKVE